MTIAVAAAVLVNQSNQDAHVERFVVGTGGVTAGHIVGMTTDGIISIEGSTAPYYPVGIALNTVAATYPVDVVTHGKVNCVTGAAEGSEVYPLDGTAGVETHTASTRKYSVGVAISATEVFVRPLYIA